MKKEKKEQKSGKDILSEHDRKLEELLRSQMTDKEEPIEGELVGDEEEIKDEIPIDNNGHKPPVDIEDTEPEQVDNTEPEETYNEDLDEREIPAKGFIYAVKEEYLPETTRLSARAIFALTFGYAKDYILKNPVRKQSFFQIYSNRLMRHNIGLDGKGRDEWFTYKNVIAQEKAEASWEQQR